MKDSFYISFGIWVSLLPFLGIPETWRVSLIVCSGLFLSLLFVGPHVVKQLQIKQRPKRKPKISINPSEKDSQYLNKDVTHIDTAI